MALKYTLLSHVTANNVAAKISQTDSYESADAATRARYDNYLAGNIFGAILQRDESTHKLAAKIRQTDSYESADAASVASYDINLAGNIFGAILQRDESTHYGLDQVIEKHANLDEDLGNHDVMCSHRPT